MFGLSAFISISKIRLVGSQNSLPPLSHSQLESKIPLPTKKKHCKRNINSPPAEFQIIVKLDLR